MLFYAIQEILMIFSLVQLFFRTEYNASAESVERPHDRLRYTEVFIFITKLFMLAFIRVIILRGLNKFCFY